MTSCLKFWLTMEQRGGIYTRALRLRSREPCRKMDEWINFYKALLSEVEGTLIEELVFVYPHYFI